MISPTATALAERVLHRADREHPADALLRLELKSQRGLSLAEARQATRAVFAWFRWFGWRRAEDSTADQLRRALELADRFAREPLGFADADLVAHAVPAWLHDEMPVSPAFARSLQHEPRLWLRARPGRGKILAAKLGGAVPFGSGPLADTLEYTGSEDLFHSAAFHAGDFEIQDLASQAVGFICAPQPGQTWWDACAGEGGKLLHLSDLMQNRGLIRASDRAARRLQKLKRRAARARVFNYRAAVWDGGPRLPVKTRFDGVLVDAPCTGVGTWQRNPHARWFTAPQDVRELAASQQQLLRHAAAALKPGGKLVYSVCSLTRSETLGVTAAFEREFPAFRPLPFANPIQPGSPPAPQLTLWPQHFHSNGMFIAAWEFLA